MTIIINFIIMIIINRRRSRLVVVVLLRLRREKGKEGDVEKGETVVRKAATAASNEEVKNDGDTMSNHDVEGKEEL